MQVQYAESEDLWVTLYFRSCFYRERLVNTRHRTVGEISVCLQSAYPRVHAECTEICSSLHFNAYCFPLHYLELVHNSGYAITKSLHENEWICLFEFHGHYVCFRIESENCCLWPQTLHYCVLRWYFPIRPTAVSWKKRSACDSNLCWMKYDCQKGCVVLKQRRQCPAPVLGEEGHCPTPFDAGRTGFHRAHGWKKPIFVSPHSKVCPRAEKCMNIDKSTLSCGNEADRALWGLSSGFMQGGILFCGPSIPSLLLSGTELAVLGVTAWTHSLLKRSIVAEWSYLHMIICLS